MIEMYEDYVQACLSYGSVPYFTFREWVVEAEDYDADMCALWLLNETGQI